MINIDEDFPIAPQPEGMSIELKRHQRSGIFQILKRENECEVTDIAYLDDIKSLLPSERTNVPLKIKTNASIYADSVGSGKTLTFLGAIKLCAVPEQKPIYVKKIDCVGEITPTSKPVRTNLIIVPHNLVTQWEAFAENQAQLRCLALKTESSLDCFFDTEYTYQRINSKTIICTQCDKPKAIQAANEYFKDNNIPIQKGSIFKIKRINQDRIDHIFANHDVCILNVNVHKDFKIISENIKWPRVVIDEYSSIDLYREFREAAVFYWFISATPQLSKNPFIGGMIMKKDLLTIKNDDKYVASYTKVVEPKVFVINAKANPITNLIVDTVNSKVKELICSGDIKGAIAAMGQKVEDSYNIVESFTKSLREKIKHNQKIVDDAKAIEEITGRDKSAKIDKHQKLIDIDNDKIDVIKQRIESIKTDSCIVCVMPFSNPCIMECCKNLFCFACLITSLEITRGSCPYCNQQAKYKVIGEAKEDKTATPVKKINMDKQSVLKNVLAKIAAKNSKARILVFSNSVNICLDMYNTFNCPLVGRAFRGTQVSMNNMIQEYTAGDLNILFIDSANYGSGLNLEMTDYVIMFHRMERDIEIQAIGRAQRFGRKKPLNLIYIVDEHEKEVKNMYGEGLTNIALIKDLVKVA